MKILNFGSCNIDYVYSLDHIVREGETATTYKLETFPGGKGLNQSIAISRAGAPVWHAGCIGEDGEMLLKFLRESGVRTEYIRCVDEKNGHAIIQLGKNGDNSIFIYPGSNACVTKELVDRVLESFGEGDIVLLQNEISNVDYIIERAYRKGMQIIFNPSPIDDTVGALDLNMISYLILNEVEAREISGCEGTEECLMFFKENYPELKVMLTLGKRGSVYVDGEREIRQPAFSVDVVDTTAAGDTFTGYFVAELSKGTDYPETLRLASAASAIAVSRMGAAPSIPGRTETLEILKRLKASDSNKRALMRERIEGYIDANIKTATLGELAQLFNYSSVYTGSMVKRLTGRSFSKLLQSKRIALAAELLLNTDMSVSEIINRIGYENETFFRKIFKEKYGRAPLEFRKRGK